MKRDKYKMVRNMSDPKKEVVIPISNLSRISSKMPSDSPRMRCNERGTKSSDPCFDRLLKAFTQKDLDEVRQTINSGLDINYQEPLLYNRTPLMYAAKYDFFEGGKLLLLNGADPQLCDTQGVTPLHLAASNGNFAFVESLLRVVSEPDPRDSNGRTPLHYAARSFTEENKDGCLVVKELLTAGAQAGARDHDDTVPLHSAALNGNASLLAIFLHASVHVSPRDKEGRTPLHLAVVGGRSVDCVKLLLHSDAPINARDASGKTPLHLVAGRSINYADEEFDAACLSFLLRHGASVVAKDDEGYNALSMALEKTMWWGRKTPRDAILRTVQLLVAEGSPITDCFATWRIVDTFPSMLMVALNQSIKVNTSAKDSPYLEVKLDMRPLINDGKTCREKMHQSESQPNSPAVEVCVPVTLRSNAETSMLNYIIKTGHRSILRHPLCSAFLHLKWLKVRKIFLLNIYFYLLFVITLTFYLIGMDDCELPNDTDQSSESKENGSKIYFPGEPRQGWDLYSLILGRSEQWVALSLFTIVILCRELLQLLQSPIMYLTHYENYMDVTLLACMVPILQWEGLHCIGASLRNVMCVVAIISWSRLMMFMGHFPAFGVYIVMFSTVCTSIIKFLAIYLPLLVAFALGFLMLLRGIPPFEDFQTSLVSSVVMMTGEIEYGDKILGNPIIYSKLFPCLTLLLFVLLIYIILSNLLVGLAVSDMSSIQKRSELLRLTRQVELMIQVENFLNNYFFPKRLQRYLRNKFSICQGKDDVMFVLRPNKKLNFHEKLFNALADVFPSRQLLSKIFELFMNDFILPEQEPELPDDIVSEATSIALNEFEIQKLGNLEVFRNQQAKSVRRLPMYKKSQKTTENLREKENMSRKPSMISVSPLLDDSSIDILVPGHQGSEDTPPRPSMRASIWRAGFRKKTQAREEQNEDPSESMHDEIDSLKETIKSLQETIEKLSWRVPS